MVLPRRKVICRPYNQRVNSNSVLSLRSVHYATVPKVPRESAVARIAIHSLKGIILQNETNLILISVKAKLLYYFSNFSEASNLVQIASFRKLNNFLHLSLECVEFWVMIPSFNEIEQQTDICFLIADVNIPCS